MDDLRVDDEYICYYLVVDRSWSRSGPTAATTRSRLKTLEMRQRKAFKGGHLQERKLCPMEGVDFTYSSDQYKIQSLLSSGW